MHAVDMSQLSDSKLGNCVVVKSQKVHVYVHLTHCLYMHVTCMLLRIANTCTLIAQNEADSDVVREAKTVLATQGS